MPAQPTHPTPTPDPSFAIVGTGALGGYYGGRLALAGNDVRFLARSDLTALQTQGLAVESCDGDFHIHPRCAADPAELGPVDWVLVTLKTTANNRFPDLLPPLVHPLTRIVTLQNGLGNEENLERLFPDNPILGGLCFVCVNRTHPGRIRHLAHGRIVLGEHPGPATRHAVELAHAFQSAGVPCETTGQLDRAHWQKLVWNIPFNGLGVASCAGSEPLLTPTTPTRRFPCRPTSRLLDNDTWLTLVRELMLEVMATARALGHELPASLPETMIEQTRIMADYRPSTLLDFERGAPLEVDAIFSKPLQHARRLGVPTPRLEALTRVLTALNPD